MPIEISIVAGLETGKGLKTLRLDCRCYKPKTATRQSIGKGEVLRQLRLKSRIASPFRLDSFGKCQLHVRLISVYMFKSVRHCQKSGEFPKDSREAIN